MYGSTCVRGLQLGKCLEMESRTVLSRSWGKKAAGLLFGGDRVLGWEGEKSLGVASSDGCTRVGMCSSVHLKACTGTVCLLCHMHLKLTQLNCALKNS